ncbi:hypothetical protein V9T40_000091 [Parthenolecanium corni]|uniref:Uncharacterized protein n=1 Tax=Parthenolecanium corni TaxID=536013 RepID=A0AAN9TG90_9HEMI
MVDQSIPIWPNTFFNTNMMNVAGSEPICFDKFLLLDLLHHIPRHFVRTVDGEIITVTSDKQLFHIQMSIEMVMAATFALGSLWQWALARPREEVAAALRMNAAAALAAAQARKLEVGYFAQRNQSSPFCSTKSVEPLTPAQWYQSSP